MTRIQPKDTSHLLPSLNPFGTHDKMAFIPHNEGLLLRCIACNSMMDSSFTDVGKCPTCGKVFTKKEFADAYIEAEHIKATHSYWKPEHVEDLKRLKGSGRLTPQGDAKPLNDVARKIVELKIATIRNLRQQSNVSQALKWRPPR